MQVLFRTCTYNISIMKNTIDSQLPIILFDGVCNLCDGFVQFVIRHDKKQQFKFTSLQSDVGQDLRTKYFPTVRDLSTIVLIDEHHNTYTQSDAILKILSTFGGLWRFTKVGFIIPKKWRDYMYNWVAKNRYRWFGQSEQCMLPTPVLRSRFLN